MLAQSGDSVIGQASLSGSPCAASAPITGVVLGSTFTFQLQEGAQTVNFNGVLDSSFSSVSGTYASPSGGCTNGDYGTWAAVLEQPTEEINGSWTFTFLEASVTEGTANVTLFPSTNCSLFFGSVHYGVPSPCTNSDVISDPNNGDWWHCPQYGSAPQILLIGLQPDSNYVQLVLFVGVSTAYGDVGCLIQGSGRINGNEVTGDWSYDGSSVGGTFVGLPPSFVRPVRPSR